MKEVIILFGEMGGGKNYHGEILAKEKGYTFLDGDTVAQPEMLERVSQFKSLTREMIKKFIGRLIAAISLKAFKSNGLVVAQALYFDEDRIFIKWFLNQLGYNVKFIWVKPSFLRNLMQIYSRPKGLTWAVYWLLNKPWFQKPTHDYEKI